MGEGEMCNVQGDRTKERKKEEGKESRPADKGRNTQDTHILGLTSFALAWCSLLAVSIVVARPSTCCPPPGPWGAGHGTTSISLSFELHRRPPARDPWLIHDPPIQAQSSQSIALGILTVPPLHVR